MFLYKKKILFVFIILFTKILCSQKEGNKTKEGKVGNIGQIRAIGNKGKTGIVRKVPNSFK